MDIVQGAGKSVDSPLNGEKRCYLAVEKNENYLFVRHEKTKIFLKK